MTVRPTHLNGTMRGGACLWAFRLVVVLVMFGVLGMHALEDFGACGAPAVAASALSVATSAGTRPGPPEATQQPGTMSAASICDGVCTDRGNQCLAVVNSPPRAPLGTTGPPVTWLAGHNPAHLSRIVTTRHAPQALWPIGLLLADLSVLRT